MLRLYSKIFKTGVLTEKVPKPSPSLAVKDEEVELTGRQIKAMVDRHFRGSLAIRQVDAGSCNGCELEIHALNNVYYDVERLRHPFRRFAAPCRYPDGDGTGVAAHGGGLGTHLRGNARSQMGHRHRRLRSLRRRVRGVLCQLRRGG